MANYLKFDALGYQNDRAVMESDLQEIVLKLSCSPSFSNIETIIPEVQLLSDKSEIFNNISPNANTQMVHGNI